jgi:photosystem II stability/assembly factor-like uncharacterized protein
MSRPGIAGAGLGLGLLAVWASALQAPAPATGGRTLLTNLTLFAGTGEGLWRSTDWGTSWQRVLGGGKLTLEGLGAARAILPFGPRIYVGGDGGLFRSEDFGEVWERLPSPGAVRCLVITRYAYVDPTILVGTEEGLLRSPDGGKDLTPTPLWGFTVRRLEWPGPALMAATDRGVFLSEDSGASFKPSGDGLPAGEVRALAPSSMWALDPVVYAAVGDAGVFRSEDGGRSWRTAGLAGRAVSDLFWLGPLLYAAGEGGVFRSDDGGKSWTALGKELAGTRVRRLLFPLAPQAGLEAFAATERGIFRTLDGGEHWQLSGLAGHDVHAIATFPQGDPPPRRQGR